jgi:NADH-quinone oxidoreductase subunit K
VIAAISPIHYVVVSALLLAIGIAGVLLRRNLIVILMSIELILNSVNINLVAFSRMHGHTTGQVFALMVMTVAVAETAVGLALLIALYRNRGVVLADDLDLLKW